MWSLVVGLWLGSLVTLKCGGEKIRGRGVGVMGKEGIDRERGEGEREVRCLRTCITTTIEF